MSASPGAGATVTLYHGSPVWFERPDLDFSGMGDGRSMSGLGFNMAHALEFCREHLDGRDERDAVIFSTEVPLESIVDLGARLDPNLVDRATRRAVHLGMEDLAADLGRLRGAVATGRDFVQRGYYPNGADRTDEMSRATNGLVRNTVALSLPDQRLWNEFMIGMGVRVTRSAYVTVAIDPTVLGPLRVAEIVGAGPRGMPDWVRPGDFAARPATASMSRLDTGDLRSENLADAWSSVRALGDHRLEMAFRKVAKLLVSDAYLPPPDPFSSRTLKQSYGFDLRDAVGRAIRENLSPWNSQSELSSTPTRIKERMDRVAAFVRDNVGDPHLLALLGELGGAAELHAAQAARRATRPQAAQGTMLGDMQRAGGGHRLSPLARALEAVGQAETAEKSGSVARGTVEALKGRIEKAFRLADDAPDGAAQNRIAFPLAADIAKAFRREDWLERVQHTVVHAIRAFAPRPPAPEDVAPEALLAACEGRFELLQDRDLPISGHPGWTVLQKGSVQLIKEGGKLSSFHDQASGISIPAVVSGDGSAMDVSYVGGDQVRTRIPAGANFAVGPAPRPR